MLAFVVMPLSVPALAVDTATPPMPTVIEIRGSHHPGFDRVVFELDGPVPATRRVRYVDRLVADGAGLPARVAGRAILRVRLEPAQAHDAGGQPTSARRRAFALPNVMTVVRASDFEGVTTYGIGLARRTAFDVLALRNPSRVVVDIRAAFPTVQRSVWYFHRDRFVDNREPFFVPGAVRFRPARGRPGSWTGCSPACCRGSARGASGCSGPRRPAGPI
jgi:hypothetical protein